MLTLKDRIAGGMFGLLCADAAGTPFEFGPRNALPLDADPLSDEWHLREGRAHSAAPKWAWSDDGAQALALADSLLVCGKLDPEDFGRCLLAWGDTGAYAVDGVVFDVGGTTSQALANLRKGVPATRAGPTGTYTQANGAIMRVLPLALWHKGSVGALVYDAHVQTLVTHGNARCCVCASLLCLWARSLMAGTAADPWNDAIDALVLRYAACGKHGEPFLAELEKMHESRDLRPGAGEVTATLASAYWAVRDATDYRSAVVNAIRFGGDTDTTAAIAGGIAGVMYGIEGIPQDWR